MKSKPRNIAAEIIADLKELHATLESRIPLSEKYTVRTKKARPHRAATARPDTGKPVQLARDDSSGVKAGFEQPI